MSSLIELAGTDRRRLLDEQFPDLLDGDEQDDDVGTLVAPKCGVLVSIDRARLVELAVAADCVMHVVPAIGTFVPSGSRLLRIEGDAGGRLDHEAAIAALGSGLERTLDEDVAYGFNWYGAGSTTVASTTAAGCCD